MNLEIISKLLIPLVLVLCLCIGYLLKNYMPTDNKIIPTVLFIVGVICGVICLGFTFESIVRGGLTGLASVGLHQVFKQFIEAPKKLELKNLASIGKGIKELENFSEDDLDKQFAEEVESVDEGSRHNG